MAFKSDFLWGSASAAYQIEGAHNQYGKGPSIWDDWAHRPGKTFEGTNGDIACDHYHRFLEDVALMKEMGLKAYRFSISWPRLLPEGTLAGGVNPEGIAFYHQLIDALIENDIVPMVTLYHWDLPLALESRYGGWLGRDIVNDFTDYSALCFEEYGQKVPYWIVMNEPNIFTGLGYQLQLHPPGINDEASYLKAFHHTALAHASTVLRFKEMGCPGRIGSSIAYSPAHAATDSLEDQEAKANYEATGPHWFLDSYFKGVYPERGVEIFRRNGTWPPHYRSQGTSEGDPLESDRNLPETDRELFRADMALLEAGARVCDFIGINYYQTAMVGHNPPDGVGFSGMNTSGKKGTQSENGVPGLYKHVRNESLEYTDWDWAIDPEGLGMGLRLLHARYGLPIVISENGLGAYDTLTAEGKVHDSYRIDFIRKHLAACAAAIADGVDLLAYCTWSFTDLLSWLNGYKKRYGFVYVDFESGSLQRYKKDSFYWYQQVIATGGKDLGLDSGSDQGSEQGPDQVSAQGAVLAIDIGGTLIKAGLVTGDGIVHRHLSLPTPYEGYPALLDTLKGIAAQLMGNEAQGEAQCEAQCEAQGEGKADWREPVVGIALSQPCATEADTGEALSEGALRYILGMNPAKDLGEALGLPYAAENDGNCAALAEVWLGAARDIEHMALVVSGTGIGGAVVIDRKIHHGRMKFAGEFGMCFTGVSESGEPVTWSMNGSTQALVKDYAQRAGLSSESIDGRLVFDLADKGDPMAMAAVEQFYRYFAIGLHNVQHVYDPQRILIGGGISGRSEFLAELEAAMDKLYGQFNQVVSRPEVALCQFGQDANLIGATYHLLRKQ